MAADQTPPPIKTRLLKILRSPIFIGLIITVIFMQAAKNFYSLKGLNDTNRKTNIIYEIIEIADLKSLDIRFQLRGAMPVPDNLVLLAIDDRSVEQVGRWPWSHEKIAQIIEELFTRGAKSLALDIVFAEPEIDLKKEALQDLEKKSTQTLKQIPASLRQLFQLELSKPGPDQILSKTINKYRDHIVLGAFSNFDAASSNKNYQPYQDYCRNEAFRRINAGKFVKLNTSFILNDVADEFVDLEFRRALVPIFENIESEVTAALLKTQFQNKRFEELQPMERRQLQFTINQELYGYCYSWLTTDDSYAEDPQILKIYANIFNKSRSLKGLPVTDAIKSFKSLVPSQPIPQYDTWTINTDLIQDSADYTAAFNADQDQDGSIRKAPLFFRTGNRIGTSFIPALALQAYLLSQAYQARIEISQDPSNQNQKILRKFEIFNQNQETEKLVTDVPVDNEGRLRINYFGEANMFPYLPAKELLNNKTTMRLLKKEWSAESHKWQEKEFEVVKDEYLKGKNFVMGATAVGIYDLRVTPYDKNYPGPEVHLTVMGNLMNHSFLRSSLSEPTWMIFILLAVGALFSFAIARLGAAYGLLLTASLLAILLYLDSVFFQKGIVVTIVLPLFLVSSLYVLLTFFKYFTEERKKKLLRSTFSKYVSPAIVDEILKDPGNVELGGQKLRLSVFFSDIRGFTGMSEVLDPQALAKLLNRYLTPMTEIIFANKGTLDKYIGDAVMAFFGAPVLFKDHAICACRAALQSLERLKSLQVEFAKEGLPHLEIGIGINSAEMSVGNMGSDIVRNYTVIGDAVNLGSRLESLTKDYGVSLVVSEFTVEDIKGVFTTRQLGRVQVKGRNHPVGIFEVICEGPATESMQKFLKHYSHGFDSYLKRDFGIAETEFRIADELRPGDKTTKAYLEKCQDYINSPPPADWSGVEILKNK